MILENSRRFLRLVMVFQVFDSVVRDLHLFFINVKRFFDLVKSFDRAIMKFHLLFKLFQAVSDQRRTFPVGEIGSGQGSDQGIDNKYGRWIYSLLSTVLLFMLAGSISTLYVVLVLVIEASRSIKRLHTYLVLPLLLFVMAWLYLRCGLAGTWQHLLLPHGYFTWRLQPGSVVYMPWVLMGIVCMIGELSGCLKLKKSWIKSLLVVVQLAGWGVFVWFSHPQYVDKHNEAFKQMSQSLYNGQWRSIRRCRREI